MKIEYFNKIKKLLLKLKESKGFFVVQSGLFIPVEDQENVFYCQFYKDENVLSISFEAVSHYNDENANKRLKIKFKNLGFNLGENENYSKEIILNSKKDIENTALEAVKIFEDIYKVSENSIYDFDDGIENNIEEYSNIKSIEKKQKSVETINKSTKSIIPFFRLKFNKITILKIVLFIILITLFMIGLKKIHDKERQSDIENKESTLNDNYQYNNNTTYTKDDYSSQNQTFKESQTYAIASIEINNSRVFRVWVKIEKRLKEDELISLAKNTKVDINAKSDIGVVFFILPDMVVGNLAWAAVDFDPQVKVRILGLTVEEEQAIKSKPKEDVLDCEGRWIEEGNVGICIRKDKKLGYIFQYFSLTTDEVGSIELAKELSKTKKDGKIVFLDKDTPEQYFVVESNGNLSAYDNYGYIVTYKKLE